MVHLKIFTTEAQSHGDFLNLGLTHFDQQIKISRVFVGAKRRFAPTVTIIQNTITPGTVTIFV